MEACFGVTCLAPPAVAARPGEPWAGGSEHWAKSGGEGEELLRAALDACLPAALEARVVPRLREVLSELLDERLPLAAAAGPGVGTPERAEKEMVKGQGLEIVKEQDFSTLCVSGTLLPKLPCSAESSGATPVLRPSEVSHSSAGIAPEDYERNRCTGASLVLHPNSRSRWIWDSLALLVFVVDMVYTTFEWAFLASGPIPGERSTFLISADICTGIFWTGDICMNFITGYLDPSTCMVEMRQGRVARHYLCTWFLVDLFATVQPLLAFIVTLFDVKEDDGTDFSSAKLLALLKVLKLTKLLRVAKLNILRRRLAQIESRTQSKVIICLLTIFQLLGVLLTASHIFACVLWFTGQQSVAAGNGQESWIGSRPNIDLVNSPSLLQQYMASMHLSVSIMTGMGTGSVSTAVLGEELLLCGYYFVSLSLVGVIVNEVAAMYNKMNERSAQVSHAITGASSFMSWYKVPSSLQVRVERYLQTVFDHKEHTDFRVQLNQWLQASGGLLAELNFSIFGKYLMGHPQLRLLPREVASQLANLCEATFFPPGEVVMKPNWKPLHMLCLRSGSMEVNAAAGAARRQVLRPGCQQSDPEPAQGRLLPSVEVLGEGDMLFHRNLLLPSAERSGCTCTCTSFCEVMTLECSRFTVEMERRCRQQLQVLRIHAAIQDDSSDWLRWALDKSTIRSDSKILSGDTVLHLCARFGAVGCIRWLLGSLGWSSDVRDSSGKTPLDVAKATRQKAVVDALVKSGAVVSGPSAAQARRTRRFNRLPIDAAQVDSTSEELAARLASAGVDVSRFGNDGAKSISELFGEIQQGFGSIIISEDGKARRVIHVARLRLSAECGGRRLLLSETEEERWFGTAGQVVKLPMKKMRGGGGSGLEEALETLWFKYIGLGSRFVSRHFERGVETLYEEAKTTGSYPGLDCLYRIHEVPYWVREPAHEACARIGLPKGDVFEVQEALKGGGSKQHVFTWLEPQPPCLEDATKDLANRLAPFGLDLCSASLRALALEEQEGLSSCVEDADGQPVRMLKRVRMRISLQGSTTGTKVLYELDGDRPHLPEAPLTSGRLERGLGELWRRLLARGGNFSFGHPDATLELVGKHFRRGTMITQEEQFTDSGPYPALRCLHVIHEVPFTMNEFHARTTCGSLGLPVPGSAAEGLAWLSEGEEDAESVPERL